jgi:hypothetical protein
MHPLVFRITAALRNRKGEKGHRNSAEDTKQSDFGGEENYPDMVEQHKESGKQFDGIAVKNA